MKLFRKKLPKVYFVVKVETLAGSDFYCAIDKLKLLSKLLWITLGISMTFDFRFNGTTYSVSQGGAYSDQGFVENPKEKYLLKWRIENYLSKISNNSESGSVTDRFTSFLLKTFFGWDK